MGTVAQNPLKRYSPPSELRFPPTRRGCFLRGVGVDRCNTRAASVAGGNCHVAIAGDRSTRSGACRGLTRETRISSWTPRFSPRGFPVWRTGLCDDQGRRRGSDEERFPLPARSVKPGSLCSLPFLSPVTRMRGSFAATGTAGSTPAGGVTYFSQGFRISVYPGNNRKTGWPRTTAVNTQRRDSQAPQNTGSIGNVPGATAPQVGSVLPEYQLATLARPCITSIASREAVFGAPRNTRWIYLCVSRSGRTGSRIAYTPC